MSYRTHLKSSNINDCQSELNQVANQLDCKAPFSFSNESEKGQVEKDVNKVANLQRALGSMDQQME